MISCIEVEALEKITVAGVYIVKPLLLSNKAYINFLGVLSVFAYSLLIWGTMSLFAKEGKVKWKFLSLIEI